MLSRGVVVDVVFTVAAGIATIVCVLLSKRYKFTPSFLIRLFAMIMFGTILLEMQVAVALGVYVPVR